MILQSVFKRLGALRVMLAGLAVAVAAAMPLADVSASPEGWGLLRGVVLPAAAPIVFMVVALDLMMCQILKSDAGPERRADLNLAGRVNLALAVLLLVSWLPVFLRATYFQ